MIRELLDSMLYGWIASTALVLFFTVFVVVTIRTLLTNQTTMDRQADIPLSDGKRRNA